MMMKLIISLILHFFILSLMILKTGEGNVSYGSLIKRVYDEYKTLGVIVASTNYPSFETTTLQILLREMSTAGIGSVIVKFRQLKETVNFHHRSPARPLVVIFIDKIVEIHELEDGIVNMDMSYPAWLALFTGDQQEDSCRYCRHLSGHPFNTKMLVSCCNSSSIVEWCPEKTNSTLLSRNQEIEKVNRTEGHPTEVLNSRQQFMVKREFRIAILKEDYYAWKNGNRLYGYIGEIVMELSEAMNLSISSVLEIEHDTHQGNTSKWVAILDAVRQRKVDIGAIPCIITPERFAAYDFSLPVGRSKYMLIIAQSVHFSVQWDGFFKVFHPNIWLVIIILLLITPLLLIIIDYKEGCNLLDIISTRYLNVWGLFCLQSWSRPPERIPSCIIFFSLFISTLVVNSGYSAALIRYLTTSSPYVPFHTVEDFVNDGTYKVITRRGTATDKWLHTTNDTIIRKMKTLIKPNDSLPINGAEAFEQLCTERVAWVHAKNEDNLDPMDPCATINLPVGRTVNIGIILPLGSEYTRLVNYHLQRFQENGGLDRLKRKYSRRSPPAATSYDPVTFKEILPLLTIFAVGCSIALIIFSQERR